MINVKGLGREDKYLLKDRAIELRKQGLSPLEISKQLSIAKGTIWHWVGGVVLSEQQKQRLAELRLKGATAGCRKGMLVFKERSDSKHHDEFTRGFERAKVDKIFAIICSLYWGEGHKRRRDFIFTNSDVSMVKVVVSWLVQEGYVYKNNIWHHDDGTREDDILNYWKSRLPESVMTVRWGKKSENYCGRKMPAGCAQIIVHNALLHSFIMGGIEFLKGLA